MFKKCLLMLGCALTLGVQAAPLPTEMVVNLMRGALVSSEVQNSAVKELGLTGERAQIVRRAYDAYAKNDAFLYYLADQLEQLGLTDAEAFNDPEHTNEMIASSVYHVSQGLYRRGLAKATTDDLREFMRHQIRVSKNLSRPACKAFNVGVETSELLAELEGIQSKLLRTMPVTDMRRFYTHFIRTQFFALDDTRAVRRLTRSERALAQSAFEQALLRGFNALPDHEALRLSTALLDLAAASDRDACDASIFLFEQILKARGQAQEWILRLNIESLQ